MWLLTDDDGWEDCVSSDGSTDDITADVAMDTEAPVSTSAVLEWHVLELTSKLCGRFLSNYALTNLICLYFHNQGNMHLFDQYTGIN